MRPTGAKPGWSVVFAAPDEWRAQIVKDSLLEEGIPAVIEPHCVPGYGTAINPSGGSWGDVLAPNACLEAARTVLRDLFGEDA